MCARLSEAVSGGAWENIRASLSVGLKVRFAKRGPETTAKPCDANPTLIAFILELLNAMAKLQNAEARMDLAQRIAHDIRSPLSVLNVLAGELAGIAPDKRELIKQVSERINHLAHELLALRSTDGPQCPPSLAADVARAVHLTKAQSAIRCYLRNAIDSVIGEKQAIFKRARFRIAHELPSQTIAKVPDLELRRILSNLLNNSIEASVRRARITVRLLREQNHAIIALSDRGSGIPTEILPRIGTRGFSYGKSRHLSRVGNRAEPRQSAGPSGYGLGVYQARSVLQCYDASLSIFSGTGEGTTVSIRVPIVN